MSIAANSISEMPIAAASLATGAGSKAPVSRRVKAKADPVQSPEPR